MLARKIFFTVIYICFCSTAPGQQLWPSPEVKLMYGHACDYIKIGNYADAAVTFKQIIILAPAISAPYEGLVEAYIHLGKYEEAGKTAKYIFKRFDTDAKDYELLAASQSGQKKNKVALETITEGLSRFPHAGALYYQQGNIYSAQENKKDALNAWVNGIGAAPAFAPDYKKAAMIYLPEGNTPWGLLYGETYLAMAHDTTGDQQFKANLYAGYKSYFDNITKAPGTPSQNFASAITNIFRKLTPVISDGMTTENLTMVRIRFLMEWFAGYADKYPFALFSYQDKLIHTGRFDEYNEWLFGQAESSAEYNAWITYHMGDIEGFNQWMARNPLVPGGNNDYNDRDTRFSKKDK